VSVFNVLILKELDLTNYEGLGVAEDVDAALYTGRRPDCRLGLDPDQSRLFAEAKLWVNFLLYGLIPFSFRCWFLLSRESCVPNQKGRNVSQQTLACKEFVLVKNL